MIKNISIIAPYRQGDIWSIPLSFYYCLQNLGYNVKIYNNLNEDVPGITQLDTRAWNEEGLKQLLYDAKTCKFVPDVIMHFDFGLFKSNLLNKREFPSAKWVYESGDDPQCFSLNFAKVVNGNFDLILSPDIRAVKEYNRNGYKAVWCPHFADEKYLGIDITPSVGAITSRHFSEPFFVELKQRLGDNFKARDEFIREQFHLEFLKQGNIVVQNSKYKEITRRIFEGMICNRLVVTDRLHPDTGVDLLFKENDDIVYFDTMDECVEKINYFIKNNDERNRIARNGYKKVLANHTITSRVTKLLSILDS